MDDSNKTEDTTIAPAQAEDGNGDVQPDGNRSTTIQSDVLQSTNSNAEPSIGTAQSDSTPAVGVQPAESKVDTPTASTTPEAKQQAKRYFYKANSKASVPPGSQEGSNSRPSFFRRLRPAHYIAAAIVVVGLSAVAGVVTRPAQAPTISPTVTIQPTTTPSTTVLSQVSTVKRGPASLYPNSSLTPGAILPVTVQQVCTPGYSSTVRNVNNVTKNQVFAEYNIPQSARTPGAYEVDHFISLELGGSNDISNLWPEPALPVPGFHQKDMVENYLHSQVCSGKLILQQAQQEISTDWYQVYLQMTH